MQASDDHATSHHDDTGRLEAFSLSIFAALAVFWQIPTTASRLTAPSARGTLFRSHG